MSIASPDRLDYDEELYDTLAPRDKDILYRFFNIFCDRLDHRPIIKDTFTQDELRKIITSKLPEEIRTFLEQHQELADQSVRTDPAVEYLAEHYDLDEDDLEISTRYELLLLLYEEELIDQLEELIIRSRIRSYSATRTYFLEEELDLDGLDDRIAEFHRKWNREQEDPDTVLVDVEFEAEQLVVLKIYQEIGPQHPNTFSFRVDDQEGGQEQIPVEPELTQVSYHQLKTIRIQIEVQTGETELVFTESFNRWRRTLSTFFDIVFSVDDFLEEVQERRSEVAEELEEEIVESVEAREDPISRARETIDQRRDDAIGRVDDLDLPDGRKEDLKTRMRTIEISGSEILDDQSIETQEFRLIATLDGLFDSVDGIEEGFREMIRQADTESQAFVLTINNRPVQFSNGRWQSVGPGPLPDRDQRALQLFFSGENDG